MKPLLRTKIGLIHLRVRLTEDACEDGAELTNSVRLVSFDLDMLVKLRSRPFTLLFLMIIGIIYSLCS